MLFGGNFWYSRATGSLVKSPDAEQAQHPPVDTQEMGLPDTACIAYRLSQAQYRSFYEAVWGRDTLNINFPMPDTERICDTPGGAAQFGTNTEPIPLLPEDRTRATTVYTRWAESLDAYERGREVSPFTSKFDAFLKGTYTLTADERARDRLFHGQRSCNSCHIDGQWTALNPNTQFDNTNTAPPTPVLPCFRSPTAPPPL